MEVTLRTGRPEDANACGTICFEAFKTINEAHHFPLDIPNPDIAIGLLTWMFGHPGFYVVVAEENGKIIGSNVLDERNPIAGVGPITVDPNVQNKNIGRRLMEAVHQRAQQRKFAGVRLVQAAFHNRSLSLYTKLGYDVREPLACMNGPVLNRKLPGGDVRPATPADLTACNQLCTRIHGYDRGGELSDAIQQGTATVVVRQGRITGYATIIGFFGHAVGETNDDLKALIAAAPAIAGSGFLLPTRNSELFRWCLANGLRVVQPLTLMSRGEYKEPAGVFLPSITY
jgi:GNAT superfamily N-acetyltransferase